jgi:hypothetical protein
MVFAFLFGALPAFGGACKKDKSVTGPCFIVHGRLSYYNGTASTRLWVIGTHHILSVPSEESEMPDYLSKLMTDFEDEVYGDFQVCPYKKHIPGHMQPVCIESGKHLVPKRRRP